MRLTDLAGRILGAVTAVVLAACAHVDSTPSAVADSTADVESQLMVMVADAAPPHFRPGAGGGGYLDNSRRQRVLRIADGISRDYGARRLDDWPMPSLGVYCVVVRVPAGTSRDAMAKRLEADPRVSWVQPVQRFEVLAQDDAYQGLQSATRRLNLKAVHAVATGQGVRVGVIDTGVDASHPDLKGQLDAPQDFLDPRAAAAEQHGTAVAGVIAARGGNGLGIVGMAPAARVVPLRACRQSEPPSTGATCTTFSLAKALQYAIVSGIRVLNLSLTGPTDKLLSILIDKAVADGAIVVASVDRRVADGGFPASHTKVVAVASRAPASIGRQIILAPGDNVLTTVPGGRWHYVSGDSFSAAHVSGLAALLRERRPGLKPQQFAQLLAGGSAADMTFVLDPCLALARIDARITCDSSAPSATAIVLRPPAT